MAKINPRNGKQTLYSCLKNKHAFLIYTLYTDFNTSYQISNKKLS